MDAGRVSEKLHKFGPMQFRLLLGVGAVSHVSSSNASLSWPPQSKLALLKYCATSEGGQSGQCGSEAHVRVKGFDRRTLDGTGSNHKHRLHTHWVGDSKWSFFSTLTAFSNNLFYSLEKIWDKKNSWVAAKGAHVASIWATVSDDALAMSSAALTLSPVLKERSCDANDPAIDDLHSQHVQTHGQLPLDPQCPEVLGSATSSSSLLLVLEPSSDADLDVMAGPVAVDGVAVDGPVAVEPALASASLTTPSTTHRGEGGQKEDYLDQVDVDLQENQHLNFDTDLISQAVNVDINDNDNNNNNDDNENNNDNGHDEGDDGDTHTLQQLTGPFELSGRWSQLAFASDSETSGLLDAAVFDPSVMTSGDPSMSTSTTVPSSYESEESKNLGEQSNFYGSATAAAAAAMAAADAAGNNAYYNRNSLSQYVHDSNAYYSSLYGNENNGGAAGSGAAAGGNNGAGAMAAAAAAAYYTHPNANFNSFNPKIDYSSYYGNYMAAYGAAASYGSSGSYSGSTLGSSGSMVHSGMMQQPMYHLSQLPPPASIAESTNVVDPDVLKPASSRKSSRSRSSKRRQSSSVEENSGTSTNNVENDPNSHIDRVFIWDLDETIILFHSLLTGSFAGRYGKDANELLKLVKEMEILIYNVADQHFFFSKLEEYDQMHIDDLAADDNGQDLTNYNFDDDGLSLHQEAAVAVAAAVAGANAAPAPDLYLNNAAASGMRGGIDWSRKMSFRYRKIKERYNEARYDAGALLGLREKNKWIGVRQDIEDHTDRWLSLAMQCLTILSNRSNCVNVLVTQTKLVEAVTKVLLFGLGPIFDIDNVYSAAKFSKDNCFDRVVQRFGRKSTYVVIGDGMDEEVAAKHLNFPFWRVSQHTDLLALHMALEKELI